jgi:hypothetical protein
MINENIKNFRESLQTPCETAVPVRTTVRDLSKKSFHRVSRATLHQYARSSTP